MAKKGLPHGYYPIGNYILRELMEMYLIYNKKRKRLMARIDKSGDRLADQETIREVVEALDAGDDTRDEIIRLASSRGVVKKLANKLARR